MASNARRDPLRELAALLRAPESGSRNLGEFVSQHADGLARELGISAGQLEAERILDDEEVAPRIRQLLQRTRDRHVQQDLERRRERSLVAAQKVGESVRQTKVGIELDVDVLLGELLVDRSMKWLAFDSSPQWTAIIPRYLVAAVVPIRRNHLDLAAFAFDRGLSFRWKAGRGGLNLRHREVDPALVHRVLTVPLAPRRVQVTERRRGGAWLGQVLREMGYPV